MRLLSVLLGATVSVVTLNVAPLAAQSIDSDRRVHLRFATFDPATTQVAMPTALRGGADTRLWIVQFDGLPTQARRDAVAKAGGELHGYLPENAYVARMSRAVRDRVESQSGVRSVTQYHPAFRIDPALIPEVVRHEVHGPQKADPPARYNIVVVDPSRDKPELGRLLRKLGAAVTQEKAGSLLIEASLTRRQLASVARLDQVLWIDRATPVELDMDNAREQGGANHVERVAGYTGKGVNGHVYEGVEATHGDFTTAPVNVRSGGTAAAHGHCTAGIVFGNGKSNAKARGIAPDATPFFTTHTSVQGSRMEVVQDLRAREVMFTTSSWGNARTTFYTSISAEADQIVFVHDIPWTQSQGNSSSTASRPQAWAKNVTSVGSVTHRDNANPADDSWRAGGGSIGPAADGRIKPDLVAYDDSILCSDMTGAGGFNPNGDFYASFGGTSGATPIVAGYNALAIQMFTDGLFGPKRKPNGTRWENRPHFSTLKALQLANAAQYAFTKSSRDNRREHVGWGFPDVKAMYDRRAAHYVVDETDVLQQGDGMMYRVTVAPGQSELKITMCYSDPPANPSATRTRINDLSLRVKSPNGTEYWGNVGLMDGNYSTSGGTRNLIDTVESVFVQNPAAGTWEVEVGAFLVAEDAHLETAIADADFGLAVVGAKFASKAKTLVPVGAFFTFGAGCPSGPGCQPVGVRNWTKTSANTTTTATSVALMDWTDQLTTICSVDLYMGAKSGTVDVEVGIHDINQRGLPGRKRISEIIRVGALGVYSVRFSVAQNFSDNDIYFFVIKQADKLQLPVSATGEERFHYEFRNNKWDEKLFDQTRWQYRSLGVLDEPIPILQGSGTPSIGNTFRLDLSNAKGSTPGMLLFGNSDKAWGPFQLPLRYATTCDLLVSMDFVLPVVTSTAGAVTVPLPIPNDKGLINVISYYQFLISDRQNPVGWVVSNGGRLKIGE